jgi:tol-pal system protein YbgF
MINRKGVPARPCLTANRRARAAVVLLAGMLSLPGCLTRTAGPQLPYVRPAYSVPQVNPVPAQIASHVQEMEQELARLRDGIERLQNSGGDQKGIRDLQSRVSFIEQHLGIEKPPPPKEQKVSAVYPESPAQRHSRQQPPAAAQPDAQGGSPEEFSPSAPVEIRDKPLPPDEQSYRAAYAAFRNGSLDQSVEMFEDFLVRNPKSQLAANGVYWIGEARFAQGRFDEAVLQFDRVIKEFPGSKKELSALLKQGQAFEKMNDPRSARIIFQKILSDFPHTAQARIAGGRLKVLPAE